MDCLEHGEHHHGRVRKKLCQMARASRNPPRNLVEWKEFCNDQSNKATAIKLVKTDIYNEAEKLRKALATPISEGW